MMKNLFWGSLIVFLSMVSILNAQTGTQVLPQTTTLSAHEILARLDSHESYRSSHARGLLRVEDRRGVRESGFETWSQGEDRSLVVFVSGEERGQKVLRLPDALYLAYPDADKPIKIQGAALRDSVAGSDFSFEDMAGQKTLGSRYTPSILRREEYRGQAVTVIELRAQTPGEAYPLLRIWVSEQDFSGLKVERYSQNERLLKTQEVTGFLNVGVRRIPSTVVMIDHTRNRSTTTLTITLFETDINIPSRLLSLEELTW